MQYFYVDVYFGSHRQREGLIIDTGSSIAAVPCDNYCTGSKCGEHINGWYDFDSSTAGYAYRCGDDCSGSSCTDDRKCKFYQGYQEGSQYSGFMVKDSVYFGDEYHFGFDGFMFSFGCVAKETNMFFY